MTRTGLRLFSALQRVERLWKVCFYRRIFFCKEEDIYSKGLLYIRKVVYEFSVVAGDTCTKFFRNWTSSFTSLSLLVYNLYEVSITRSKDKSKIQRIVRKCRKTRRESESNK